jgi:hypothetical protein
MYQKIGDHINKTMENIVKLTEIKELITKRFLFLEKEEEYKLTSIIFENLENSESDKFSDLPQIKIIYFNQKASRKIQIDVTITNIPYLYIRNINTRESINDNDYFTLINKSKFSFYELPGQDLMEKLESYLTLITKELKGALHGVINGCEWIDVPQDWGPYK